MRIVVQRVSSASVAVGTRTVSKIDKGLFVLLGIKRGDTKESATTLAEKLAKLRIMGDESQKMNKSVGDVNASIMVVSQFTLYANTKDGNRPSFIEAEDPDKASILYKHFIGVLEGKGIKIQKGEFGAYMTIDLVLDGPSTIILES